MARRKQLTGMDWLYHRLDELGYRSLSEFAEEVGINKGNIHRYFTGKSQPTVGFLPPLCAGLQVSVEELLFAIGIFL